MSRVSVTVLVGVLSIFVLGVVAGITADRLLLQPDPPPELTSQDLHERTLSELQERFRMSDSQMAEIDEMIRKHQLVVDDAWQSMRPRLTSAVDSVHAHIAAMLDPQQREAFHRWLEMEAAAQHGGATPEH